MAEFFEFHCGCRFKVVGPPPVEGALPLMEVDDEHLPECPVVWELLGKGLTKGVFQLESRLGQQWARRLKPTTVEHLCALGALLRPGCLKSKDTDGVSMTERYCRRKNREEEVVPLHPALDEVLATTYGVLVFQEQFVRICKELAGFNLVDQDKARKSVSKKDQVELAKVRDMFLSGCRTVGVASDEDAQRIWGVMQKSGRYSFNKCVSCDTIIRRYGSGGRIKGPGYTVEHMYRVRNDPEYAKRGGQDSLRKKWKGLGNYGQGLSMCEDGRVRPNTVVDIRHAGFRPTVRVTLENGASIRVTDNHKFPTPDGILTAAELRVGDELFVCDEYEPTDSSKYRWSDFTNQDRATAAGTSGRGVLGEDNRWFTNGSWSDFQRNKVLVPPKCLDCGRVEKRMEIHHANGDRTNSSLENLIRLCASCHKKREYAAGRARRGEKGYPTLVVRIRSIEDAGSCETYDVTMEAPDHNFVTGDNIVTCNSHSMSYALLGYDSAYMKAHFPHRFYANWLWYAKEKADWLEEVAELVEDAKLFDVAVQTPDVRLPDLRVTTDGVAVRFGLSDVKGVGPKGGAKLAAAVAALGPGWTWERFALEADAPAPAVSSLIAVGGFRQVTSKTRTRLLNEWQAALEMTDKERAFAAAHALVGDIAASIERTAAVKSKGGGCANEKRASLLRAQAHFLRNPPSSEADTPGFVAASEARLLGVPITCSRVDAYAMPEVNASCKDVLAGRVGHLVVGVEVREIRVVKTKSGKTPGAEMAYLTVSDGTCVLRDVVVFPQEWAEFGWQLREEGCFVLQGEGDRKRSQFVVKAAWEA